MGIETKIQWCHHTWNPWRGCTKVSPGCANCYAETQSRRNPAVLGEWGPEGRRVLAAENYWKLPHQWHRAAVAAGEGRRVFCASLADVFEDNDQVVDARERVWDTIDQTPALDWLLLTKRPENLGHMVPWCRDHAGQYRERFWPNVWLGTSVEDQARADERIPKLLEIPAAVRFLSIEPLLGPIDLGRCWWRTNGESEASPYFDARIGIDWVIVGGESGPDARPCDLAWIRSIVEQCKAAGVACFVKQIGSRPAVQTGWTGGPYWAEYPITLGQLHDPKGGDPDEWPADLRVREFPTPRGAWSS